MKESEIIITSIINGQRKQAYNQFMRLEPPKRERIRKDIVENYSNELVIDFLNTVVRYAANS